MNNAVQGTRISNDKSLAFPETGYSCFSNFVFKINGIRQDFSFPKQKFLYLNSQPADFQSPRANCEWETQKSFQLPSVMLN